MELDIPRFSRMLYDSPGSSRNYGLPYSLPGEASGNTRRNVRCIWRYLEKSLGFLERFSEILFRCRFIRFLIYDLCCWLNSWHVKICLILSFIYLFIIFSPLLLAIDGLVGVDPVTKRYHQSLSPVFPLYFYVLFKCFFSWLVVFSFSSSSLFCSVVFFFSLFFLSR